MFEKIPSHSDFSSVTNFIVAFSLLGVSISAVWFCGDRPWIAAAILLVSGGVTLLYSHSWKLFVVYLVFTFFGTLQEIVFIGRDMWAYSATDFFSIPVYLPFVWGNISILCVAGIKGLLTLEATKHLPHQLPCSRVIFLVTLLAIMCAVTSLFVFSNQPFLLAGAFLLIDLGLVLTLRSVPFALVGLIALLCGSVGDVIAVMLGRWQYSTWQTIAGVPPYIFIGWDTVGLIIAGVYLTLDVFEQERSF